MAAFLDSLVRTPSSSTAALIDALRVLTSFGMSAQEAAMIGMGRFPIGAEAFYRDDFGEYRSGPPVHGHQGTDIWAAFDAPIRAPADGIVDLQDSGHGGKGVLVTEPNGTYYYLAHLNGFAPGLSSGDSVRTGQLIGFNGDSGNARGGPPHVHFEIHPRGGAAVNPKPILDQWLNEALAGIPALVAPYLQSGSNGNRPITAVGMVRHFDGGGGLLTGPSRPEPAVGRVASEAAKSQRDADSVLSPLTPEVLRQHAPPGL